ncbi:MAG: class I SAM-dependent methyltransferase [Myxococcota bacterium]
MSRIAFTGERLVDGQELFGVDLARHRAAYAFAQEWARDRQVVDLGCGTGYGSAELSDAGARMVAVDRVPPDSAHRREGLGFVRADLSGVPFRAGSFDLVVSFQVLEHLEDPAAYLDDLALLLRPEGTALLTTPNLLQSERENPFHVHEYEARELETVLGRHFEAVEMRGIGASPAVARYHADRLRRIRRITRLDPLALRRRLPRAWVHWLFARFAVRVRRGIRQGQGLPSVDVGDFPVGPADPECLDLLAVCRRPRVAPRP